jgi:glycosyltransferase involved in cell wall biosynthesis
MNKVDCAIADQRVVRRTEQPVLSICVPTFNRTPEMVVAVRSLASQITDGLESKVEIVISDNASGSAGQEAIRQLADEFACISYYVNAQDESGSFQIYAACWRTTGRWTWTFGSDDFLFPGGIAAVVQKLESEDPSLLTMNKRILSRDLSEERLHQVNRIPDRNFDGFDNLMRGVGVHQVAFLSSCVERTETARALDPTAYRAADTFHNYVIAYLAKHRNARCTYMSSNHLGHRVDNSVLHAYSAITAEDIGIKFPLILWQFKDQLGLPDDFYEQINGSRYINTYDPPKITFVDNMLEYMLRTVANGRHINAFNKFGLEQLLSRCRPGRLDQFAEVWRISEDVRAYQWRYEQAQAEYERQALEVAAKRREVFDLAIKTFTDKIPPA